MFRHHQSHRHYRRHPRELQCRCSTSSRRASMVAVAASSPPPRRSCHRVLSRRHRRCPGARPPSSLRASRERERTWVRVVTKKRSCAPRHRRHQFTTTTAKVPPPSFQCRHSCPLFPSSFCPASPALKSASTTIRPEGKRHCYCLTVASSAFPIPFLKLVIVLIRNH
ncbi:uncharacterized protein LOC110271071 [Arachis ipaensis]|uniref:uncharacterized protein LOC110271071 n=1 Tax=Arachis ipaensis TaxID=130454 RepID=UPI000A2B54C9|nr:uncharacterized protein LOC110271071 [Arachis ipaensis]XP_025647048.1 uncharacterized protein LOC112742045 [Arachis hypogaea]